ncbi:MAG: hypothetical protein ACOC05_09620, partial [Oceanicaulis sp.]
SLFEWMGGFAAGWLLAPATIATILFLDARATSPDTQTLVAQLQATPALAAILILSILVAIWSINALVTELRQRR